MPAWHEATWVGPEDKAPRRRFPLSWLWLLVIPVALIGFSFARYNNYWQYTEMTVSTMECTQSLDAEPKWPDMEAAGCELAPLAAELVILDGGRQADKDPDTDGTTWTFDGVPGAFSTLGINATLKDSAGQVHIVNAEAEPPEVLSAMNGDVGRRIFSQRLEQGDSRTFYLVVSPLD